MKLALQWFDLSLNAIRVVEAVLTYPCLYKILVVQSIETISKDKPVTPMLALKKSAIFEVIAKPALLLKEFELHKAGR